MTQRPPEGAEKLSVVEPQSLSPPLWGRCAKVFDRTSLAAPLRYLQNAVMFCGLVIVEGGVNALAIRDMAARRGKEPPTVVVTGGVGVRAWLSTPHKYGTYFG